MKIWCFLCFRENEEGEEAMKEGLFGGEKNGNLGENVENEEEFEDLNLGLSLGRRENMTSFEEIGRGGFLDLSEEGREGNGVDVKWQYLIGGSWRFDRRSLSSSRLGIVGSSSGGELGFGGESSSLRAAVVVASERKEFDRDLQHKRAKVHANKQEDCHYTTTTSSNIRNFSSWGGQIHNNSQNSSVVFNNSFLDRTSMLNDGDNGNLMGSGGGRDDDGDGSDTSQMEDLEVRMDLTDDLLHMVFSFLDHINLCGAAMVCRQWRAASAHEDFWRCLNFENRNISIGQFEDMCRRYPNATEVNIFGTPAIHLLVMKAISSLRNLAALTLGKGELGDTFFHAVADCSMLKSLVINDATLVNGMQEIPISHDRLRHLHITKCRALLISVRCPQLETLSLKRSNMAHVVLNCPLLHDIDIGSCHKLSDAAIRLAATSCFLLESLDMSNCSCVSDETLRGIADTCTNLRILDSSYCPNISLESVRLPMLTVLKLHSCEGITSASMAAISRSNMLEVLELDNCSLLTSVSLDLPRLLNIRLVHCRKFVDLNLRSLMLTSITVSNCPLLHRINITSNSLLKLVLQKQESLTTLALQCQSLQEVDLTDCESLTNAVCEVFSDGGGCPMLKSLVLDNCERVTAVRFCCTSLVSLSLVGCRGITVLELTAPYLEQVYLDGCDHLEKASFCPVGLRSLNLGICPKLNELHIEAPRMVLLELKGCGVLAEASIDCPLLTSLDASFCSQLKDDCLSATTAACPLIESLILMSCPSVSSDGLYSLRCLPHLTLLDLSYTFLVNLQPVFESCLQLRVLKLQACKYLTDSSLEALYKEGALPSLCELDLSYGTLCQSAIEELLAYCTHLTHVSLNGCVNMHDLNWGYRGNHLSELTTLYNSSGMFSYDNSHEPTEQPNRLLQNLNCVGCANIKKVLIPPMACCFHLSSLNLSLSANLKEVDVACYNLCFLNLSNCCSLEILKLECPRLSSLFLQSCIIDEEAVQKAISGCNMLETLDVRFCPKICSMSMGRLRAACPSLKRIFSSISPSWCD